MAEHTEGRRCSADGIAHRLTRIPPPAGLKPGKSGAATVDADRRALATQPPDQEAIHMTSSNRNTDHRATAQTEAIDTLQGIVRRIEAGEVVGVMALAVEPDGSAVRHLLGTVREDRHRAAGLALQLASDVLTK